MSVDLPSFGTHPPDAALLLVGDVTDEATLHQLIDEFALVARLSPPALVGHADSGPDSGADGGDDRSADSGADSGDDRSAAGSAWTHLQYCVICTGRLEALLGLIPAALVTTPVEPQWTDARRDGRIQRAVAALLPPPERVDGEPISAPVPGRPFRLRGRRRGGSSSQSGGVGVVIHRWPVGIAAVAVFAVAGVIVAGVAIGLRPVQTQTDAVQSPTAKRAPAATVPIPAVPTTATPATPAVPTTATPATPAVPTTATPATPATPAMEAAGLATGLEAAGLATADLGSFSTFDAAFDAAFDRFGDRQRAATSGRAKSGGANSANSANPAGAAGAALPQTQPPPQPAGARNVPQRSGAPTPGPMLCSSVPGEPRVTATVNAKPVLLLRTTGPAAIIDRALDPATCAVLAKRSVTVSSVGP